MNNNNDSNFVLTQLKKYLELYNWSTYRLAKEAGIPYSSLNNLFTRDNMPTVSTLQKLTAGLGVTMSEFFKDLDESTAVTRKLSDEEVTLLDSYARLAPSDKKLLNTYLSGLLKESIDQATNTHELLDYQTLSNNTNLSWS